MNVSFKHINSIRKKLREEQIEKEREKKEVLEKDLKDIIKMVIKREDAFQDKKF